MKKTTVANAAHYIETLTDFDAGNLTGSKHYMGIGRANRKYIHDVAHADFVVYSYATPIAWAKRRWDGLWWTIIDEKFSVTTSRHQNIVRRTVGTL